VNRDCIDPAEVMTADELSTLLQRAERNVPRQARDETVAQYTKRLRDVSLPFDAHCCHMGAAIKHPVPDHHLQFLTFGHSDAHG